jgi:uncharacterized protein YndB with AHSA1/START domain
MTTLTIERSLAATPARVWRAFISAAELAAWLWPASWETTAEVELRVGGRYRIASPTIGMAVSGEYLEIEDGRRLVQTWQWDGDDQPTLVAVELHPDGDGTRLTIVHSRFVDATASEAHAQGWNDCLDRLPAHLTTVHR